MSAAAVQAAAAVPAPLSAGDVERLLAEAQADLQRKAAEVDDIRAEYRASPSIELKNREIAAEVARDVAEKHVEKLEAELDAARDRERQAELRAAFDRAAPLVDEAAKIHAEYEALARRIARMIPRLFEIESALRDVNGRLPEGAERYPLPSEIRGFTERLTHTVVERRGWVDANGEPFDRNGPSYMQRSKEEGPPAPGARWGSWQVELKIPFDPMFPPRPRAPFDGRRTQAEVMLQLPALTNGAPAIWPPNSG